MRTMMNSGVEWVGEIPQGWEVPRLKATVHLHGEKVAWQADTTYVGLENIESHTGRFVPSEEHVVAEGLCSKFRRGDILFNKLRPYLWKCLHAEFDGVCSPELLVLRDFTGETRFLYYALMSHGFMSVVDSTTYGAKMPRANWTTIGNMPIPLPPSREQRAIAGYLDGKCSAVDSLVEGEKKSIELLQSYKQLLITEAVTKGLDRNVPLKDSGVEWIGDIPESWEVRKLSSLFKTIGSGTTPDSDNLQYYDGDIPWVQTGDLNDGLLLSTNKTITDAALRTFSVLKLYPIGTLLIAMYGATTGKVGILGIEASTNQACCALSEPQGCETQFIYHWFVANRSNILTLTYGSGQPNISQKTIRALRLPIPPLGEQRRIVEYLNTKCTEVDVAIEDKQKLIDRLLEYKRSLIYEAVTGKRRIAG